RGGGEGGAGRAAAPAPRAPPDAQRPGARGHAVDEATVQRLATRDRAAQARVTPCRWTLTRPPGSRPSTRSTSGWPLEMISTTRTTARGRPPLLDDPDDSDDDDDEDEGDDEDGCD